MKKEDNNDKDFGAGIFEDEDGLVLFDPTDDEDGSEVIYEDSTDYNAKPEIPEDDGYVEIYDEVDGKFYKMKRMRPEYVGRVLAPGEIPDSMKPDEVNHDPGMTTAVITICVCFVLITFLACFAIFCD